MYKGRGEGGGGGGVLASLCIMLKAEGNGGRCGLAIVHKRVGICIAH